MKIGDKVMRTPQTIHGEDASGKSKAVPMKGTVVYIHPKGRYHTVEFACGGGTVRESFPGTED